MAKPASLPEWASSGDKTEPSGGKKASGWTSGEKPSRQYFNWWMNLVWLWIVYINSGDLEGDHSIDGGLIVGGDVEINDSLVVGSTMSVAGLITANNGISVPTTKNITLVGTATLKHGERRVCMGVRDGVVTSGSPTVGHQGVTGSCGMAFPAGYIPVGARITAVQWRGNRGGAGSIGVNCYIYNRITGVTDSAVSFTVSSGSSPATVNSGAINYTLTEDHHVVIDLSHNNAANVTNTITVVYDHP